MKIGQRVYWTDPDDDECSGAGTIQSIHNTGDDTTMWLVLDDGSEVQVFAHECLAIHLAVLNGLISKEHE